MGRNKKADMPENEKLIKTFAVKVNATDMKRLRDNQAGTWARKVLLRELARIEKRKGIS